MGSQSTIQATVVFADLIGSTGLFEVTGNAKAAQAVTGLTQWICEIFVAHGGHIVKTLGDGVLATFPVGQGGIDAVVEMQRRHQKHMASTRESMRMPIRVGLASGDVEIVDSDCYGDAVNVASRLSDLSGAHQIWATDQVLAACAEAPGVRFRPLGPIVVRGRTEPCLVYQVEWKVDENSDLMTMQGDLDSMLPGSAGDALGGQVELTWLDVKKTFRAFDMPIHIGRDRSVEFVVKDPRVSRDHARIEWRNGSFVLVDVSSYGCWLRFEGASGDLLLRRDECVLHGRGEIAMGAAFTDLSVPTVTFNVG
jgi:adenylate cyclase